MYVLIQGTHDYETVKGVTPLEVEARIWQDSGQEGSMKYCRSFVGPFEPGLPAVDAGSPSWEEFTREELIESGLNPEPTCWSDSGISPVERAVIMRVAEQFPGGAYAEFMRAMDAGEAARQ